LLRQIPGHLLSPHAQKGGSLPLRQKTRCQEHVVDRSNTGACGSVD
jgi:hypothetical protein